MDDRTLISLFWERSESAITETDQKYHTYCFSIAHNILSNREDSDECVNDTWFQAWNTMPPQFPTQLKAYLGRICRNLSLDRWRSLHAQKRTCELDAIFQELDDCVGGTSPEQQVEAQALADAINRFLAELPPAKRICFLRRYWYADPIQQIAQRQGVSVSQVKSSLFRTRKQLREALEQDGFL
jgi:RNA polymerase sigma-70 factor (ECF subfamily)